MQRAELFIHTLYRRSSPVSPESFATRSSSPPSFPLLPPFPFSLLLPPGPISDFVAPRHSDFPGGGQAQVQGGQALCHGLQV